MKIIIKRIWGILICSIMLLGMAACSSSPSPWSQGNDSPWKSKRMAEADSTPSDEFINEAPMDDPVPMEEEMAEPVAAESEAWPYTPPEDPAPVDPVLVETPAEPASNEAWARGLPASEYIVQLYAGRVMSNVTRYQETHGLADTRIVTTDRSGDVIHVLVHAEIDKAGANQYAADAEAKTGSKPWIRTAGGLQRIVP